MSSLILRAPGVMSAPLPGTPKLPDTLSNLSYELSAADLVLADGALVLSWIARGAAPLVNRTYNYQYSGWGKPTFSMAGGPGGKPAVLFNGAQQIANGAGTVARAQPLSYAVVVKSATFASTQARVFSATNLWLAPGVKGYYTSTTAGVRLESGDKTTGWEVIVVVFDGDNSKIKAGRGAIIKGPTAGVEAGRNILGGNSAALSDSGLSGGIAYLRAYERALNDSDIEAVSLELRRAYGLA